ncbi:DUF4279 domain-containing protein [Bradyrhizobium sp. STM 3843]|uniref:DUF4279 domain-containing protein n=1 Tax=Bradyrhizobium sp. STM 3843 TaxID=551947 RepID=UPI0011127432|nr:DUF4279 domain-containing protein [Bradyrhizobium sp. STM 3843]
MALTHPTRQPEDVSSALMLEPGRCWSKGSVRTSPDGALLGGFHKENYWMKVLAAGDSDDIGLARCLSGLIQQLSPAHRYLQQFVADGGCIEFRVMWTVGEAWPTETFKPKLLGQLAEMQIKLSISTVVADSS